MGRTFENRKNAMLKRSDRDSKAFTRCGRQIAMAVRAGGPDPDVNPQLRRVLQNARAVNMPKDRVQGAIDRASGIGESVDFEEIVYEGYGPHGVPMMVVTATDNPTRTVANVRLAFNKCGGNLGSSGCVSFMFAQMGVFRLDPKGIDRDALELELIDHGLDGMDDGVDEKEEPQLILRCARDDFGSLNAALEDKGFKVASSGFEWIASTTPELDEAQTDEVLKLVMRLEDDDDVQAVFHNLG